MQRVSNLILRGGLDYVTPHMAKQDGRMIGCSNYEADAEGYRRFIGEERFDGRPRPSDANYWLIDVTVTGTPPTAGQTVTGASSGATGTVLLDQAGAILLLTDVTGSFTLGEALQVSAVTFATATSGSIIAGADDAEDDQDYLLAAAAVRRALIQKPSGSGPVRGVAGFGADVYCWRDNAGGTAGQMFKATSSGWALQSLGHIVAFTSGGTTEIAEGDTVTGATSGATATVRRVVRTAGVWGDGDAEGWLYLSDITGTFVGENLNVSAVNLATIAGAPTAVTLPPGGRYETLVHNFYGNVASRRLYAANGVGRAFEWDGTTLAFMHTGLSDALDKPEHIAEFQNRIWLGYPSGSWTFSVLGTPLLWIGLLGAGEIGIGDTVTGAIKTDTVLVLGAQTRIDYISALDDGSFFRREVSQDSGIAPYTATRFDDVVFFGNDAVRTLRASDTLGGFRAGSLSRLVEPLMQAYRKAGVAPVGAARVRGRDLYRVFMSDKSVVSIYLADMRRPEITLLEMPEQASCVWSGEVDGIERSFVGTEDGWVRELDRGTSFDGEAISAWARFNFHHRGQPHQSARWHSAVIEGDFPGATEIYIAAEPNYGDPANVPEVTRTVTTSVGGFLDQANLDQFSFDAPVVGEATATLDILGSNLSVAVRSETARERAHVLKVLSLWHTMRGLRRRAV